MRKLLTFLIALGAIAFGVCAPSPVYAFGYGFQGGCGGYNSACASAPSFSLTFGQVGTGSGAAPNLGTLSYASGNTRVIVAVNFVKNSGRTSITGITVGGAALTQVSGAFASGNGAFGSASDIWVSSAPLSGSSGAVIVTFSDSAFSAAAATYSLVTSTPAVSASNQNVTSFGSTVAAPLSVPSGGAALIVTGDANGTAIWSQ